MLPGNRPHPCRKVSSSPKHLRGRCKGFNRQGSDRPYSGHCVEPPWHCRNLRHGSDLRANIGKVISQLPDMSQNLPANVPSEFRQIRALIIDDLGQVGNVRNPLRSNVAKLIEIRASSAEWHGAPETAYFEPRSVMTLSRVIMMHGPVDLPPGWSGLVWISVLRWFAQLQLPRVFMPFWLFVATCALGATHPLPPPLRLTPRSPLRRYPPADKMPSYWQQNPNQARAELEPEGGPRPDITSITRIDATCTPPQRNGLIPSSSPRRDQNPT